MYLWTINIYSCITFIILKYTNSSWSSVSKNNQIKKWAEYLDRYFPKEDIQMAKKHMKRCSTSLTIRELHIKITMSVVIIKKSTNNKCWNEYGEKEILLHCWWECKLVQLLWKTVWRFLRKLKIELTYDPAIPLLRIYRQNDNSKRYMHPYVHSSTVHNNQDMSIDRWMNKKIRSDQISPSVVSDSLRPHESQHAKPPCPSPTPGVHSDSCPSSQWCHPAISSSVVLFSSCPQSLPASESFPMSQLFSWGGQSTGVSALASCPSTSGVCPSSCPLNRWCHPTISSSVALFSFCLSISF